MDDGFEARVELFVMGLLDPHETATFEEHLAQCEVCRTKVAQTSSALVGLVGPVPPRHEIRDHVLDFTYAPRTPLRLDAYAWEEIAPGVRVHVFRDDRDRGVRAQLMWNEPGATRAKHLHLGDEEILVLEGSLVVGQGEYAQGDICHVRAGWFHEERSNGSNCVCYVVHRTPSPGTKLEGPPDPRCLRCVFYPIHSANVLPT
jgi:anti-sigma factor ChrR (cupin superfamily)